MMVNTVSANLAAMVTSLKQPLARLLEQSSIYHQPTEVSEGRDRQNRFRNGTETWFCSCWIFGLESVVA